MINLRGVKINSTNHVARTRLKPPYTKVLLEI